MCSVGIRAGMSLDLGGIAKGYIAGRMARRMHQAGAVAGLVAAAGDAYAFGLRPASLVRREGGSSLWSVAVLDPRYPLDRSHFYTTVYLRDQAVDTSGHYYRGYTIGGRRYSHILDPRTGRPVDARLASITVVAPDPALSDGLATAIAVLGAKDGLALVESLDGVECLLLETVPPENPPAEGQPPAPVPPEPACPVGRSIRLVAHRSSGFAALEAAPPR
jgi:thiamine biosynthesis lipoprotein